MTEYREQVVGLTDHLLTQASEALCDLRRHVFRECGDDEELVRLAGHVEDWEAHVDALIAKREA